MTTHRAPLSIAYIGNFQPAHSTENHVAETLRRMGHAVTQRQEDDPETWADPHWVSFHDVVLWTRTGSLAASTELATALLAEASEVGTPTVGFHLDRWWGLNREGQVHESPFFRCDLVCTADGGHEAEFAAAGINHLWSPPAVAEFEMGWGRFDPRLASEIAFVGSWSSYHAEWPWRRRLVRLVAARYGNQRFRCWPAPGQEAVRGHRLRNLYASTTVVVGDSCLNGSPARYWSDRIPETLGRGGLLIHPEVEGLQYEGGEHLLVVPREDIEAVYAAIECALEMPINERLEIQRAGMAHVAANHTYRHRMQAILDHLGLNR